MIELSVLKACEFSIDIGHDFESDEEAQVVHYHAWQVEGSKYLLGVG